MDVNSESVDEFSFIGGMMSPFSNPSDLTNYNQIALFLCIHCHKSEHFKDPGSSPDVSLKSELSGRELEIRTVRTTNARMKYREDSSNLEIPYFVAKFVAKMIAKGRGPDVAVVGHLIFTPVKLSSQP
ncbi:hypothetical protein AVEN_146703-1 [Araneus ventricosus]|uniref:Uncharacterized protein n=1 Tax=Araneus ventricosus TaxID=182803 RepID=A0A4Y2PFS3_ARAVE|nr:hypothetical protein AVEN_146703-1 [Araneus ventricosus]